MSRKSRLWVSASAVGAVAALGVGALLGASGPPAPVALAQGRAVSPADFPALEQAAAYAPPPEADCRRLGFSADEARPDRSFGRRAHRMAPSYAPPPPPPPMSIAPPPPLLIPALPREERRQAEIAVQEMVVTGGQAPSPTSAQAWPQPLPGSVNRDRYPDAASNPVRQVADAPVSTFSIDVDTAAYANVRRHLREGTRPPRDAVRVEELINYFDYEYPRPAGRDEPFAVQAVLTESPWAQGKRLLHVGVQGYAPPAERLPPLNLVFLVDVSGSMQGPDRLELAKRSLDVLIGRLRPQDRVSLAVYAGAAGQVLSPTPGADKLRLRCAVGALEAGGSTAGGQGLALAYRLAEQNFRQDAVNRVILMTDGDFNVGIADPGKLEDFVAEKRKTGVYLSVYGFGAGNYNDLLMQTLTQAGNGTAGYVDSVREARKLFQGDFTEGLFPIADDVKIQVEFNPARVSEYRLIGYETRMLAREDFNNDRVDAGEVGAGASVTAVYELTPVGGPSSVDPLRYGGASRPAGGGAEVAFLKLRYKRPGAATSQLMERAVADRPTPLAQAPASTRWAAAVAGYGQLLRGEPYLDRDFDWTEVQRLAASALGEDPDGLKAEFLQLARAADAAGPLNR